MKHDVPSSGAAGGPGVASTAAVKAQFLPLSGPGTAGASAHPVHVIRAPGRVNLIGEHTDYNDGFVLPMAIEPEVRLVCRGRDDGNVRIASSAFPGEITQFSIQQTIERGP